MAGINAVAWIMVNRTRCSREEYAAGRNVPPSCGSLGLMGVCPKQALLEVLGEAQQSGVCVCVQPTVGACVCVQHQQEHNVTRYDEMIEDAARLLTP